MAIRTDLDGLRVRFPNRVATWLIDQGIRRGIPDEATYNNLFKDWNGIYYDINIDEIDAGDDVTSGAILARGVGEGVGTWLITNGVKRSIPSDELFNRYYFDWGKIQYIPASVLDGIPSGPDLGP